MFLLIPELRGSVHAWRRLLDMLEVGVERYRAIKDFREAAARVQTGNKVRSTNE